MKSTITTPDYFPSAVYEDPDALKSIVTDVKEPEVKVKPVPRPRSKTQLKTLSSTNSNILESAEEANSASKAQVSHYYECPADSMRPKPLRPPPKPPSLASTKSAVFHLNSNTGKTLEPPAGIQPPPPPLPPKRPPRPSFYYDVPTIRSTSECTGEQEQSRRSSLSSDKATTASPDRPALPPRPTSLPHYATSSESSSLQTKVLPQPETWRPTESVYSEIEYRPYLDILPVEDHDQVSMTNGGSTLQSRQQFPTGTYSSKMQTTPDNEELRGMLGWLRRVSKSELMAPALYGLNIEEEIRSFHQRATDLRKALRLYNLLMMKRNEPLRDLIAEFTAISTGLDKMQKKSKTMDIAGGTTGAVGGVTAVLGIALAPVTMGTSLIATAVGAGMVASAGGLGAHSVKQAKKKIVNKMTMEKLVYNYKANVVDLERCLGFVLSVMNELRRYDVPRLQRAGADMDALKTAHLSQFVVRNCMDGSRTSPATRASGMSSERLLDGFAKEMDLYFSDKDGQKLKKSCKGRFSGRVQLLAENLQEELDHLNRMWETLS